MARPVQGKRRREGKDRVKVRRGHGKERGERTVSCKRMSDNRMLLKLNINTGNDHLQVRFDYDFKNTEMLDLIEDNLQDGIKEMKVDGVVTNDEALDFLQSALHGMAIGIAATRQQIEEEQE